MCAKWVSSESVVLHSKHWSWCETISYRFDTKLVSQCGRKTSLSSFTTPSARTLKLRYFIVFSAYSLKYDWYKLCLFTVFNWVFSVLGPTTAVKIKKFFGSLWLTTLPNPPLCLHLCHINPHLYIRKRSWIFSLNI